MTSQHPTNPYADAAYAFALFEALKPKWALEIIGQLDRQGPLRFTDLKHSITLAADQPVHGKTIRTALAALKANDFVEHRTGKPAVYAVTLEGSKLVAKLDELGVWVQANLTLRH